MIFYSNNFIFKNTNSKGVNIHLVYEDTDVLNKCGIPFNINNESNEITLSFCYSDGEVPFEWTSDVIEWFLEWMITDDYEEFISEDNTSVVYFLKGVGYQKRFTSSMTGIIDITFEVLSPYAYKYYEKVVSKEENTFEIYNHSNFDNNYKPIIILSNIASDYITLTNETTGKTPFYIENSTNSNSIYIDNLMGTITDENSNNKLMDSNRSWIELSKGLNVISVDGICDINIKAYYPVMV